MMPSKLRQLLPYAIVVFLGYVGFSLPLPVLPEMFLDLKRSILPPTVSMGMKTIFLGLVLAAYPSGQLIGAPFLGLLSDRWGRKRIILCSLVSTAIGYVLTAIATGHHSVLGIFGGLFLCGLSEGNVAIAQAVIGDVVGKEEKVTHFGWINLFTCAAFIVGPLLGGWLADPENNRFFTFATPFWLGAAMSCAAFAIMWRWSHETKKQTERRIGFLQGMKENWSNVVLKSYYFANFFLYFGIYAFWNCLAIYLERAFHFTSSKLAYVMAYDSFFFAIGLLFLVKPIAKLIKPFHITGWAGWGLAVMLILIIIPAAPSGLLWTIPPVGMILALLMTNSAVMVSDAAGEHMQGQAMGSLQSIQV
jgi:MFS transporter, DHA1 family, tetracycline resistance protein